MTSMIDRRWIVPDWPAPACVRAVITTRSGGWSSGPFGASDGGGLNLGDGANEPAGAARDAAERVQRNRRHFGEAIGATPCWLRQVHGNAVHVVREGEALLDGRPPEADAALTRVPGFACSVLTADCLPVLLCDSEGQAVAAVHAGWRGMAAGVIQAAVQALRQELCRSDAKVLAYLGPAIGACHFEVGLEVLDAMSVRLDRAGAAFRTAANGRAYADLDALARLCLAQVGVEAVYGGGICTYCDADRFFSFRRDRVTGRMASAVWLA